jgi:hypothetical protein
MMMDKIEELRTIRRERQKDYRARLKRSGYRRIEVCLPPRIWRRMESELLNPRWVHTHPGAALAEWIEETVKATLEFSDTSTRGRDRPRT